MRIARCIALTMALAALAFSPAALAAGPTTITDTTSTGATPDGAVGASEYAGFSVGVGSGFGGVVGAAIELHVDSDVTGNLFLGLKEAPGSCAINDNGADDFHVIVIYIDAGGAGIAGTAAIAPGDRTAEKHRAAIAGVSMTGAPGNQSDLTFAPGFTADYAIAINGSYAGLWQTSTVADPDSLDFVKEIARAPETNDVTDCQREYSGFSLADLGLAPGQQFRYVATLLNAYSAYRSNEFHGVVNGDGAADGALNIGANPFTLASGDFNTFQSFVPPIDLAVANTVDDETPAVGAAVTFTITVTNPDMVNAATGVTLSALLPTGLTYADKTPSQGTYDELTGEWSVGTLATTGQATLTIDATVNSGTAGSTLDLVATLTGSTPSDPNGANDSATAPATPSAARSSGPSSTPSTTASTPRATPAAMISTTWPTRTASSSRTSSPRASSST